MPEMSQYQGEEREYPEQGEGEVGEDDVVYRIAPIVVVERRAKEEVLLRGDDGQPEEATDSERRREALQDESA